MKARWQAIERGPSTAVNWRHWLERDVPLDPYLVWADVTQLQNFDRSAVDDRWPILVELIGTDLVVPEDPSARAACRPDAACHPAFGLMDVPAAYKYRLDEAGPARLVSKFVTASVAPTCIEELFCQPDLVVRFQLGLPRIPQVDRERVGVVGPPGSQAEPRVVVGVIDDGFAFAHAQFRDPVDGTPRTCYLWDQNDHNDALRARTPPWRVVQGFKYGAELYHEDIVAALTGPGPAGSNTLRDPLEPYRRVDYVPRQSRPDTLETSLKEHHYGAQTLAPAGTMSMATHGTSVMSLAAGRLPAVDAWDPVHGQRPAQLADAANAWPLIFVQLPVRTTLDSSGGSLGVHVLDGMRYIVQRARSIPEGPSQGTGEPRFRVSPPPTPKSLPNERNRVLINLSYGAIAGPHDGTSILEEAIRDLVVNLDNVWVVLAVGNAHTSRAHARLVLEENPAKSARLTWRIGPDNLLESYLELWLPDRDTDGMPLDARRLDTLRVKLTPPHGLPALDIAAGQASALTAEAAEPHQAPMAGAVFARRVAQGKRGTMVLLAVARTQRMLAGADDDRKVTIAPHGDWTVELSFSATAAATGRRIAIHAWAERNDQLWGHMRPQQSTVAADDQPPPDVSEFGPAVQEFCAHGPVQTFTDGVPQPFAPDITHGSIANAFGPGLYNARRGGLAVGGYRLSDLEMADYSGSGPTRGSVAEHGRLLGGHCAAELDPQGPGFDAPSDIGQATRGLRTIGLRDGGVARIGGTSAAAPLVTRAIAATLHADLTGRAAPVQPHVFDNAAASPLAAVDKARRSTLTPTQDDRFRRGRKRLTIQRQAKP